MEPYASIASVYEALYGEDLAFLECQVEFIRLRLGSVQTPVLDIGCGTGRHLAPLAAQAYTMCGVDRSLPMLNVARLSLAQAALPGVILVQADMLDMPFECEFGGAICLESPLAHLLSDVDLARALDEMRRVLLPGATLIVELFDYPASLGDPPASLTTRFVTPDGQVSVRERHRFDRHQSIWHMEQRIVDRRGIASQRIYVHHVLRIRTADAYAAALEDAGFAIRDLLVWYPGTPEVNRSERRQIFVAQPRSC